MDRTHEANGELRTATYSSCERYRYRLTIEWEPGMELAAVIGLNPSTATEREDDNTVRRVKNWARQNGYGGFHMLNAYAFRSTDPKRLWKTESPVGRFNDEWIVDLATSADVVVCCWGGNIKLPREEQILELLKNVNPQCFSTTKAGRPGHPLYLPSPLTAVDWRGVTP